MSASKIVLNTRTPFAQVPNDFLQNSNVSLEAKGMGSFLQSLPAGWQIHPKWIRQNTGAGERVWRKIAKELIEYGCLKLVKGGNDVKGSYYLFSFYDYYQPPMLRKLDEPTSKPQNMPRTTFCTCRHDSPRTTFCECRKMSSLINKQEQQNKKTVSKKHNKDPNVQEVLEGEKKTVVCVLRKRMMDEAELSEQRAIRLLKQWGPEYITEKLSLLIDKNIKSKAAYFTKALNEDFKPCQKTNSDGLGAAYSEEAVHTHIRCLENVSRDEKKAKKHLDEIKNLFRVNKVSEAG